MTQEEHWRSYVDHDLVVAQSTGLPWQPDKVRKRFRVLAVDAGLRPLRLHDLRHGQASLMLAAVVDLAIVFKRPRYSSVTLAADTYQHLIEGVGKATADAAASLVPHRTRCQPASNGARVAGRGHTM